MAERVRRTELADVHAAYLDARGWALSASSRRLRWRFRRLPKHSDDQVTMARRKAITEVMADRGLSWP